MFRFSLFTLSSKLSRIVAKGHFISATSPSSVKKRLRCCMSYEVSLMIHSHSIEYASILICKQLIQKAHDNGIQFLLCVSMPRTHLRQEQRSRVQYELHTQSNTVDSTQYSLPTDFPGSLFPHKPTELRIELNTLGSQFFATFQIRTGFFSSVSSAITTRTFELCSEKGMQ